MALGDVFNQQAEKAIEEHLPKIKEIFQSTVGETALTAAKNDKTCELLFAKVHKQLPLPVRLVIKRDAFVRYCFANRDKLI